MSGWRPVAEATREALADPSDLCRGCEGRLHQAESYDALAARIREASQ